MIEEKRSYNLCSTYMLPLVGLKRSDLGETNFINSYVDETNTYVVIELKHQTSLSQSSSLFKFGFHKDNRFYAAFEVPTQLRDTLTKFREGKYSEFSDEAKTVIRKKSGLQYKVQKPNGKFSSARELLALDKDRELKKVMEMELGTRIHDEAELASLPGDENFLRLNISKTIPAELSAEK